MSEALEVFMTAIIYRKNAGLSNGHSHTYLSHHHSLILQGKKYIFYFSENLNPQ